MRFTSVVFPAPFGPMRPTISPCFRRKETPRTARTPPKVQLTSRSSSRGTMFVPHAPENVRQAETRDACGEEQDQQHHEDAKNTGVHLEEVAPRELVERHERRRTQHRPEYGAGAAEEHHHDGLDRYHDVERVRRVYVGSPGGVDGAGTGGEYARQNERR